MSSEWSSIVSTLAEDDSSSDAPKSVHKQSEGPRRHAYDRAARTDLRTRWKSGAPKKCDAIEGILDEGKEIMEEYEGMPAIDAGLLAAAQAVEHYEISRYGTLKAWAGKLNMNDAVKLLDATLAEEKKTDE
ncbi:ferritin-like domain-containing protein, partial [Dyella sp.]|uniref:YciE/YciF ferroxidase family protein n=1 Tax=Dyella sp. TaxID=1869338 RepID=UPI002D788BCC